MQIVDSFARRRPDGCFGRVAHAEKEKVILPALERGSGRWAVTPFFSYGRSHAFSKDSSPSVTRTVTASPSRMLPRSISVARGSSMSRTMARLRGRAP